MSSLPRIVLSSRNKKKIEEIAELMAPHGIALIGVTSFSDVPEVVEDADSFAGNAAKKASEVAKHLNEWAIADDSGLCVDALHGAPGIYSARYAGMHHPGTLAADEANNQKLLQELANVPTEKRTAHYVCAVALSDPSGRIRVAAEGRCGGRILREYHGENGFGYDPLFLIPEYHKTFGELDPAVKRHLSHRAKAFEHAIPAIVRLFAG
jgi:XTP/dITP diphosphohydrolase